MPLLAIYLLMFAQAALRSVSLLNKAGLDLNNVLDHMEDLLEEINMLNDVEGEAVDEGSKANNAETDEGDNPLQSMDKVEADNEDTAAAEDFCGTSSSNLSEILRSPKKRGPKDKRKEKEAISEIVSAQELISTNGCIASSNTGKTAADLAAESNDSQEALKSSQSSHIPRRLTRRSFIDSSNLVSSSEITRETVNGLDSSQHDDNNDMPEICALDSSGTNVSQCLPNHLLNENVVIASSPLHDQNDIAKGEERIRISLSNDFTNEKAPPYFHYIPRNVIYQNAHVNFSLAQIGDEDCCLNCFCNCVSAPIPCACTQKTGGEFVYTLDGLLKKEFLDECISMNRYPEKHRYYCKSCPIEKSSTRDSLDPCKGHLARKFIKECWSKCGCSKQCGNRVAQRGITRNLQVFYTDDGRGWGLKTLEELPKGAFVCEYVGEILTIKELFDRTLQRTHGAKQTYPMLLDANWGAEEDLRDEEALCLDATVYGNIGRFINHRCSEANLVEIPVEWETPDHHYYHLAFFTTRKIEALEELTRDYGIDFRSRTHPIKAFKCRCGSRHCRVGSRSKARLHLSGSK